MCVEGGEEREGVLTVCVCAWSVCLCVLKGCLAFVNFWLRTIWLDLAFLLDERHDNRAWKCLARPFNAPRELAHARITALMPLSKGGLGLGSAMRTRHAAHWAIWADSLPMVKQRHPDVAAPIVGGLERDPAACFTAVRGCLGCLRTAG